MTICAGASAGGHMKQLLALLGCETGKVISPAIFITTDKILKEKLKENGRKVFIIGECNRKTRFKIIFTIFKSFISLLQARPDVVITTGALPLAIYSRLAKSLYRSEIIWIDSVANINELSMSGRWALKFADRIYTQWPQLVDKYKNVEYAGNVI